MGADVASVWDRGGQTLLQMMPKSRANPTDAQTKVFDSNLNSAPGSAWVPVVLILGNVSCYKKKGTHGSPVSSWQALRARGSVSALRQKTQMFNGV